MALSAILVAAIVTHGGLTYSVSPRCTPPEHIDVENACQRPGVNPHPTDKQSFFICVENPGDYYSAWRYSCPGGTSYSQEKVTCVPDDEVEVFPEIIHVDDCLNKTIHCRNCTFLNICAEENGNYTLLTYVNCTGTDKPYCDSGTSRCVKDKPVECYGKPPCTGVGFFPIFGNCRESLRCQHFNGSYEATTSDCGEEHFYVAANYDCKLLTKPSDCWTYDCKKDEFEIVPYGPDDHYYQICAPGDPPYVFYCKDGYDPNTMQCKVKANDAIVSYKSSEEIEEE